MSASKYPKPCIIHTKVGEESIKWKMKTGIDPKAVYLGRKEMALLLQWAFMSGILDPDIPLEEISVEGDKRPVVCKLPVYQVNEENYINFS